MLAGLSPKPGLGRKQCRGSCLLFSGRVSPDPCLSHVSPHRLAGLRGSFPHKGTSNSQWFLWQPPSPLSAGEGSRENPHQPKAKPLGLLLVCKEALEFPDSDPENSPSLSGSYRSQKLTPDPLPSYAFTHLLVCVSRTFHKEWKWEGGSATALTTTGWGGLSAVLLLAEGRGSPRDLEAV